MPLATVRHAPTIDYYMLHDATPSGAAIGFYAGQAISETVVDQGGRNYVFEGIALRRRNGQFDVDGLKPGEFIVEPGLVYCLQPSSVTQRRAALRVVTKTAK